MTTKTFQLVMSPVRAYHNYSVSDLTEREQGIDEETRVFAALLFRHNVAPEQVLLDAGCKGFQDDRAHHDLAEAATRLMGDSCDASDVDD
jgi:hypothetical protein